ncbi:hypothetical protein AB0J52_08220 [Spirillospora sp. NPDC049652]
MIINISVGQPATEEDLASLYDWLTRESDIRQNSQVKLQHKDVAEGEMGTTLDIITLFVTGTLAFPSFAETIMNWKEGRRRDFPILVEVNNKKVVIPEGTEELAERIVRQLSEAADAS